MNIDAIIAARRAELLATRTGQEVAANRPAGQSCTPGELARRPDKTIIGRHINSVSGSAA